MPLSVVEPDRLPNNELHMTQELIANMLGVRREGVTEAAGQLQAAGLIHYHRGRITMLDRAGLEARSCGVLQVVKKSVIGSCPTPPRALRTRMRHAGEWRCVGGRWCNHKPYHNLNCLIRQMFTGSFSASVSATSITAHWPRGARRSLKWQRVRGVEPGRTAVGRFATEGVWKQKLTSL